VSTEGKARRAASGWLASVVAALLLAAVAAITVEMMRSPKPSIPKVFVGSNDQVYYSHAATMQEATTLGHALQQTGFFSDRGTSVMLTKNKGVTTVSFVLNNGAWNQPETVSSFEEIGRRVAGSVGGFPIRVHLADARWVVHKSLDVGKIVVGDKDVIYYLGSASEGDAVALGKALHDAGYLRDLGVSVVLAKDGGNSLGFVVGNGVWGRSEAVTGFENLARRVAPSIGGTPLQLRLLDAEMEPKREVSVR
jgi:hypothetical protein